MLKYTQRLLRSFHSYLRNTSYVTLDIPLFTLTINKQLDVGSDDVISISRTLYSSACLPRNGIASSHKKWGQLWMIMVGFYEQSSFILLKTHEENAAQVIFVVQLH